MEQALASIERVGPLDALVPDALEPAPQVPIDDYETPAWVGDHGLERVPTADTELVYKDGAMPTIPECTHQYFACWPFVPIEIVKRDGGYTLLENGCTVTPSTLSLAQRRLYSRHQPDWPDRLSKLRRDAEEGEVGPLMFTPEAVANAREVRAEALQMLHPDTGALHYYLNSPPQLVSKDAVSDLYSAKDLQEGTHFGDQRTLEDMEEVNDAHLSSIRNSVAVPMPKRYPAPLAMRVRVEDGELPPDYVRVTVTAQTIEAIEESYGLTTVAEELETGSFDLPVGSVNSAVGEAAVVPFPMRVPLRPRTVLVSQEPRRKTLYAKWLRGDFKANAATGIFSRLVVPYIPFSLTAIPRLVYTAARVPDRLLRGFAASVMAFGRRQYLRYRAGTVSADVHRFVYGSDTVNVFDDLRADLREIREALDEGDKMLQNDTDHVIRDWFWSARTSTNAKERKGELVITDLPGPRIDCLRGRTRHLADYLFPKLWFDPDVTFTEDGRLPDKAPANLQPGGLLTALKNKLAARTAEGLKEFYENWIDGDKYKDATNLGTLDARTHGNFADSVGMGAFHTMSHRSDLCYNVEIGDSQFDVPIQMRIEAREMAGIMAGRVACGADELQQSFAAFTTELDEFVQDVAARLDSQQRLLLGYVPAIGTGGTVKDIQEAVQQLTNTYQTELAAYEAELATNPGTTAERPKPPAKAWFMDRFRLQLGETKGESKLHPTFEAASIYARMRELLGCDYMPRAKTPSHQWENDKRTKVDYEKNKRTKSIQWAQLGYANAAEAFLQFNDQDRFHGLEQAGFVPSRPPTDADGEDTLSHEKMLVPPQPHPAVDHRRARHSGLPFDCIERRLPQLIKLKTVNALGGWDPLRGVDEQNPNGALADLAPLAAACRRAARFVRTELDVLVDDEVEALHFAATRSGGDPAVQARDVEFPKRRRLQFVSLYRAPSHARRMLGQLRGFRYLTPLPPIFTPPTLPLGASLPDAVSSHLHAALRVMFGASVLTMEDVLGVREAVPDVVRSEARNAFATLLVNCLLARKTPSTTRMIAHDVVESVVVQARRVAMEASRLIKAVYDRRNSAVLVDADELLRALPTGPMARLALRHTAGWRTDLSARASVLRSDVWRTHVRAFADALATVANDTKAHPALIPLLNIQTSYLAVRPHGPRPTDYELESFSALNAYEARRSLVRGSVLYEADRDEGRLDANNPGQMLLARMTFADLLLARPVLWRMDAKELDPVVNRTKLFVPFQTQRLRVERIDDRELRHAWAARRVQLPLRLLVAPLESPDDSLETALVNELLDCLSLESAAAVADDGAADSDDGDDSDDSDDDDAYKEVEGTEREPLRANDGTRLSRRGRNRCTYYVPVSCAVLPDLRQEYDPKVGLQQVLVDQMAATPGRVRVSADKMPRDDSAIVLETLVLNRAERADSVEAARGRAPEHPLFFCYYPKSSELHAHVPSMPLLDQTIVTRAAGATVATAVALPPTTLIGGMALLQELGNESRDNASATATRDDRVDRVAATLADARRTLMYATDRMYQALLHAMLLRLDHEKWNQRGAAPQWVLRVKMEQLWEADPTQQRAVQAWTQDAESRWVADTTNVPAAAGSNVADTTTVVEWLRWKRGQLPVPSDAFAREVDVADDASRARLRAATTGRMRADQRTLLTATLLALSLLPEGADIAVEFPELENADVYQTVTSQFLGYSRGLHALNVETIPLAELVSALAAHCVVF